MKNSIQNWKTAAAGIAVIALGGAFLLGHISMTQFLGGFATLTGTGLIAARDAGGGE